MLNTIGSAAEYKKRLMMSTVEEVIKHHKGLLFENTTMALDCICETLHYGHGIRAKWSGRSIYVGDKRVASIETCKEGKSLVGIYRYKMIEN